MATPKQPKGKTSAIRASSHDGEHRTVRFEGRSSSSRALSVGCRKKSSVTFGKDSEESHDRVPGPSYYQPHSESDDDSTHTFRWVPDGGSNNEDEEDSLPEEKGSERGGHNSGGGDSEGVGPSAVAERGVTVTIKELDTIVLPPMPDEHGFRQYQMLVAMAVQTASGRPDADAIAWVQQAFNIKDGPTEADLWETPLKWYTLSVKLANALYLTIKGELARRISLETERSLRKGLPVPGLVLLRQLTEWHRTNHKAEAMYHILHIRDVKVLNGHLESFQNTWNQVLELQDKAPDDDTLHVFYLEAVKSVGVLAQDIAYYNRLPDDHADRSYHWLYNMVNHYLARTRKEAVTANIRKGLGPLLAPLNQTQRSGTVAAIENSTNKKEPKGKGKGKDKKKKESGDVGGGSWQKLPKKEMPCKYFFSNDPTTKCHKGR